MEIRSNHHPTMPCVRVLDISENPPFRNETDVLFVGYENLADDVDEYEAGEKLVVWKLSTARVRDDFIWDNGFPKRVETEWAKMVEEKSNEKAKLEEKCDELDEEIMKMANEI